MKLLWATLESQAMSPGALNSVDAFFGSCFLHNRLCQLQMWSVIGTFCRPRAGAIDLIHWCCYGLVRKVRTWVVVSSEAVKSTFSNQYPASLPQIGPINIDWAYILKSECNSLFFYRKKMKSTLYKDMICANQCILIAWHRTCVRSSMALPVKENARLIGMMIQTVHIILVQKWRHIAVFEDLILEVPLGKAE